MNFLFWRKPQEPQGVQQVVAKMPSWQRAAVDTDDDATRCRNCSRPGVRVVQLPGHSYAVCDNDHCLHEVAQRQLQDVVATYPTLRVQALQANE